MPSWDLLSDANRYLVFILLWFDRVLFGWCLLWVEGVELLGGWGTDAATVYDEGWSWFRRRYSKRVGVGSDVEMKSGLGVRLPGLFLIEVEDLHFLLIVPGWHPMIKKSQMTIFEYPPYFQSGSRKEDISNISILWRTFYPRLLHNGCRNGSYLCRTRGTGNWYLHRRRGKARCTIPRLLHPSRCSCGWLKLLDIWGILFLGGNSNSWHQRGIFHHRLRRLLLLFWGEGVQLIPVEKCWQAHCFFWFPQTPERRHECWETTFYYRWSKTNNDFKQASNE